MTKINKHSVFRYVVPFKTNDKFKEVCYNVENFDGNLDPKWIKIKSNESKTNNPKFKWILNNENNQYSNLTSESDLYKHIKNEFVSRDTELRDNKVGISWLLENNDLSLFTKFRIYESKDYDPSWKDFMISKMGLYLFRNNLGFLWYEVNADFKDYADLEAFQNSFKELNHLKRVFALTKESNGIYIKIKKMKGLLDEAIEYALPISFGDWIDDILKKTLNTDIMYIASRKNSYETFLKNYGFIADELNCGVSNKYESLINSSKTFNKLTEDVCDKAILYSYITTNGSDDVSVDKTKRSISYHLTNGYKESYLYTDELSSQMYQPFDNVLWFVTREGCSISAWPLKTNGRDKNKENGGFFNGNFATTVSTDYFHLFIRGLYQSYSLLLFSERIQYNVSGLKKTYEDEFEVDDINMIKHNRKVIEELALDINLFFTKNITTSVSHINHQNDFYNYLVKQLRINEESECIIKGLDALNEIIAKQNENDLKRFQAEERERKELKQKEDDAKSARIQSVLGLVAIFESCSLLVDWKDVEELDIAYILNDPFALVIALLIIGSAIYTIKTMIDAFKK